MLLYKYLKQLNFTFKVMNIQYFVKLSEIYSEWRIRYFIIANEIELLCLYPDDK
jgi:hypothetical protein